MFVFYVHIYVLCKIVGRLFKKFLFVKEKILINCLSLENKILVHLFMPHWTSPVDAVVQRNYYRDKHFCSDRKEWGIMFRIRWNVLNNFQCILFFIRTKYRYFWTSWNFWCFLPHGKTYLNQDRWVWEV